MLKLFTVVIGVQSALVRRDAHRSQLQQQEEKKAVPVVQPASTPKGNLAALNANLAAAKANLDADGNVAALWGCKTDEYCVPRDDLPLEVAKIAEKECPDSPACKYQGIDWAPSTAREAAPYCKCAPLAQPASTPESEEKADEARAVIAKRGEENAKARLAEEARIAEESSIAAEKTVEEMRLAEEAQQARLAEEARIAEETIAVTSAAPEAVVADTKEKPAALKKKKKKPLPSFLGDDDDDPSSMIESSSDADAEISPTKALTLLLGAVHTSQILYYLHLYQMSDGRPHLDDNGYNDYNGHNFIHYPNDNDLPGPESSK